MKNQNFVVEVIKDGDSKVFVVRNLQGMVINICNSSVDLATFFNEIKFKD